MTLLSVSVTLHHGGHNLRLTVVYGILSKCLLSLCLALMKSNYRNHNTRFLSLHYTESSCFPNQQKGCTIKYKNTQKIITIHV